MSSSEQHDIPTILAGPVLRRCTASELTIWLATSTPLALRIALSCDQTETRTLLLNPDDPGYRLLCAGKHLYYALIKLSIETPLPSDTWIDYSVAVRPVQPVEAIETGVDASTRASPHTWQDLTASLPHRCYPGKSNPGFLLPSRIRSLLHGSCRKPHHPTGDGLCEADRLLDSLLTEGALTPSQDAQISSASAEPGSDLAWPSLLMMTGDQIYADDVAGPMLHAIHQVIRLLGLPDEPIPGGEDIRVDSAQSLYHHPACFYHRERLLPSQKRHYALIEVLFGGVEKPVFTTDSAHNHLITLGEVLAMYLLVWSPTLWKYVDLTPPSGLDDESLARYESERKAIENFVDGLGSVQRVFAHIPTAMIFDDHDITDDWNLSREWDEVAYGHPFSRRVIGNAVVGYLLNQAWGNNPEAFDDDLLDQLEFSLRRPGHDEHDGLIEQLFRFGHWHYTWKTQPPLVVVDTRTHRWRSESAARQPSGLMDWEALTDLQQTIKGHPAVLLVSPAPIFGVKLIETIQRVFSWCGKPLMVDAENWMAHPGAAHAILNIFRHPKTPQHFVVLSGDVHYSFVYDVELRGRVRGPDIWQICSSGLRNEFPAGLLDKLDRANRWLYSPRSPLNWFTRRRHMKVIPRKPEGTPHGRRLLNATGIGLVELDEQGVPWRIRQVAGPERWVEFTRREDESRWH